MLSHSKDRSLTPAMGAGAQGQGSASIPGPEGDLGADAELLKFLSWTDCVPQLRIGCNPD